MKELVDTVDGFVEITDESIEVDEYDSRIYSKPVTTKLEVLNEGELIFGSRTNGSYFVREYEDDVEVGGAFFKTEEEAKTYMKHLNVMS